MPPRSSGCFTCRKRKIRCDEGRPGCAKCKIHGVDCPGYRKERSGIEFEDQTSIVVQRAKNRSSGHGSSAVWKVNASSSTPKVQVARRNHDFTIQQQVFSPVLEESRLYQTFLDIYMPKMGRAQSINFKYIDDIMLIASDHPALRDGLNTLALVQIGHINKDERLTNAAIESYGKALASLAKAVSKATSVHDDTVLAAASLLMVCEFYDRVRSQGAGWFGHVFGVEQLLLARGPESLQTDLALQLFYNSRHGSMARSYILRTADPYATPEWRAAAKRAPSKDWAVSMFDVSVQVPGLLQRFDELDPDPSLALLEADLLLADCERIEIDLQSWLASYHQSIHSHGLQPYTLVSVNEFKVYASLVSDRTMSAAYCFTSFLSAYVHSQYWVAYFHVRATIKALHALRLHLDPAISPSFYDTPTEQELTGYIYDMCHCFPSFVQPEAGTQGHIGIFLPLGISMGYFQKRQDLKWLQWGTHVKENIFSKGLSQPTVGPKNFPRSRSGGSFKSSDTQMTLPEPAYTAAATPEVGFVFDDLNDVDLAIDWGHKAPGMAAVADGSLSPRDGDGPLQGTCTGQSYVADDFVEEDFGSIEPWEMTLPFI